jgi:hypothetical protein
VASTGVTADLTLVGGLMVAVHAARASVTMRRSTDDMDALVDYVADRGSLTATKAALAGVGFDLSDQEQHAYRFVHADGRKVDLMVADHLPGKIRPPRLGRRPVFVAPAGAQALMRRDHYILTFAGGARVELGVPDPLGALVAKGAAYMADNRDRDRHLDDAAVLLACIDDASELAYDTLSKNDRRRLRAVLDHVRSDEHPSWSNLDTADRALGLMNAALIRSTIT